MNPINIARGLLDQHELVKDSDPDKAQSVREQLEAMADDIREAVRENRGLVDPVSIEVEDKQGGGTKSVLSVAAAEIRQVGLQLDDLLGGGGTRGTSGTPAGKRTTKAAEPPNKTTA
jgi:hypothetical protein